MRAKPVYLRNGLNFVKIEEADLYFKKTLNFGNLRDYLTGEEASAVDALYRDYCEATAWDMPGEPQKYFRDWNMTGKRATKSFYIHFSNGKQDDFSYIKAVRAVANWSREKR